LQETPEKSNNYRSEKTCSNDRESLQLKSRHKTQCPAKKKLKKVSSERKRDSLRSKSIHGFCFWVIVSAVGRFYDPLCTTLIFYCFARKTRGHISIFPYFFADPEATEKNAQNFINRIFYFLFDSGKIGVSFYGRTSRSGAAAFF